jgi:hypothetical protein
MMKPGHTAFTRRRRELERHRAREREHPRLPGVVVGVVVVAGERVRRAHVHDHPAAARDHRPRRALRDVEDAVQDDVHDLLPLLDGDVEEVVADRDARVVDDDVEPAPSLLDLVEGAVDLARVRDVGQRALDAGEIDAQPLEPRLVSVESDHAGPLLEEPPACRRADPTGTARHEHPLVDQPSHRRPPPACVALRAYADEHMVGP